MVTFGVSKRPPCVRSKRPLHAGITRTCVSTCARGAGTHGDVFEWTHGCLHFATQHTPHNTTQDTTTAQPQHNHNNNHNNNQPQPTTANHNHNTTPHSTQHTTRTTHNTQHTRVSFGEPLGHVITLCGQILVSRTDGDPLPPRPFKTCPCSTFKTFPFVPAPRAQMFQHVRVVPVHRGTF